MQLFLTLMTANSSYITDGKIGNGSSGILTDLELSLFIAFPREEIAFQVVSSLSLQ